MNHNCRTTKQTFLRRDFLLLAFLIIVIAPTLAAQQASDTMPADTVVADSILVARTPAPPISVTVHDLPNDAGGSIKINWGLSPDDVAGGKARKYRILRAETIDGKRQEFTEIGDVTSGATEFIDGNATSDVEFYYKVMAVNFLSEDNETIWEATSKSDEAGPVKSSAQWFDWRRINVFVGVIVLCGFILYYINQAKAGKKLFIRKIAGLEAVEEADGPATEIGKKIIYNPRTQQIHNVQTNAGLTILGRVAEMAAQYETWLEVPVSRSLVLVTAKEVVKEAYTKVGRPDAYQEDQVHYLTDDQFGYAAGIDGMVVREKPATIFYMGAFYAEALILAETGNSIGAIQIAGTAMPSQLPFFVASCDYTLIGEELFAASAYLSREPKLLGSLKGQDMGKAVILIAIVVGVLLETFGIWKLSNLFTVID